MAWTKDSPKAGNSVATAEREKRLQAEQSLRQSEEVFRLLVEGVRDYAIFMLDPEGHVATWNRGAERIKGYSAEEVIGQHFSKFYQEKDIARGWPEYELKVAATEGRFEDEGWRVRKDGSLFWANVIITAIYEGDLLRGFSKVTRDLTERKRTEEELREARDRLEERVEERTAELKQRSEQIERLVEELAVADRRKNEFLATLAHELRNPLAPIRNALQILHLSPDEHVRQQALGVIDRQLGQMVRLVDDLLDISRITNNKLQLRKERIDLAEAIRSALETTRSLIDKAGHELTVRLPAEPVYVEADLTRLAQVFTNLLNNSTKYTETGGHIWVTVETQGHEAVVSVRDTGIGITTEHLPHLFEMFSQAASALERSGGGLGVGLALARGVVELHGGTITASSEGLGKGSEMIVRLPVAPAPASEQQLSSGETDLSRGNRCRVLIADDNRDSADSLSLLLELSGYETRTAHDGVEAIEAARAHGPDVALLDIGMPKVNGYEVARRIRQEPWGQRMLLVAITGWGQEDDKQQARDAGFDHHLTKPVDLEDLRALLEEAQGRRGQG
ncbi:MAG TPA: ATP-binding protein [Thermoanaerobaculia bacterium]|nr:ATP-binding protein [Thermoanaerobaculia bacterium]